MQAVVSSGKVYLFIMALVFLGEGFNRPSSIM